MVFGKHINKYYLKYGFILLLGVAALVLVDVQQLRVPEFYRMVINGMNHKTVEFEGRDVLFDMPFLLDHICLPMIGIILSMVVGRFLWRVCFYGAANRVEAGIRFEMFHHCKSLSQEYYAENKVGDLMSLFTNDLETVQDCFGNGILTAFDALFMGGLSFIKMLRMDKTLTAFSLIPVCFIFAIGILLDKILTRQWEQRQEAFSALSDFSQENFSGISVIKAFAKEVVEAKAFLKLNKQNEKTNIRYTQTSTVLDVLVMLSVQSIVGVILGYGGYLVYKGTFDAGQLVEFIGYFTSIVWPVEAVAMLVQMSSKAKASLNRISQLLEEPVTVKDTERVDFGETLSDFKGEITFKNLSFTYPGSEREALSNIDFTIHPGEQIGILGKTGAGKTTLVDLIARTYNVKDHTLYLDGKDVNTIPLSVLRQQIAYVPQDNFLFSDTISNNIAFAFEDDSDKEAIIHAAKMADVHVNIEGFPHTYDTVLGERGVTVSGGQKQRISIARALMKNAGILILDDSVSAVDTKTEKIILENLRRERAGKTTLLIAHRISTIQKMDRVLYIEDGRIAGFDTFDNLYKNNAMFAEMVEQQKLEDLEKEGEA